MRADRHWPSAVKVAMACNGRGIHNGCTESVKTLLQITQKAKMLYVPVMESLGLLTNEGNHMLSFNADHALHAPTQL